MNDELFFIDPFCRVDDRLGASPKDPEVLLAPSEIVTLGLLYALKAMGERPFYRWISRNWRHLFP